VWKGALEWVDKRGGTEGEQKRTVNCKISCIVANGEVAIKAENWPPKLYMQLIPKAIVASLGSRFLSLRASQEDAGCVHFSSQVCDIKVLMLLYNNEKKVYFGFIPNDQNGVVERIKDVIKQQRLQQQQQQALRAGGGQMIGRAESPTAMLSQQAPMNSIQPASQRPQGQGVILTPEQQQLRQQQDTMIEHEVTTGWLIHRGSVQMTEE
ncbi:unnamed protein product, partial [Cyprideis torosa]